jgi:hypothetical protein
MTINLGDLLFAILLLPVVITILVGVYWLCYRALKEFHGCFSGGWCFHDSYDRRWCREGQLEYCPERIKREMEAERAAESKPTP